MRNRLGKHNQIGAWGELIARKWLKNNDFTIVVDNYQKKWGEIDIIAQKNKHIHFVEVKTVSYETVLQLEKSKQNSWRPEDNVHPKKVLKLQRTIESWLMETDYDGEWQIDILTVKLVVKERLARITCIDNVIL